MELVCQLELTINTREPSSGCRGTLPSAADQKFYINAGLNVTKFDGC